jgi:asparaginyl-tRNA synthetase
MMDLARRAYQFHREALPGETARRLADDWPRHPKLEKLSALPAHHLRRCGEDAAGGHAKGALENKFEWGGDLGSPDETYISSQFDKPVMVHRYPAKVKAFYMEPDPQRPELALCVDVLAPEGYGEIIGGSQRMASYDLLLQRIHEHGLPEEAFKWYLDLRKYGSVPHADSAWALSGRWPGSADWSMCGRRFRFRGCCTGCIRRHCDRAIGPSIRAKEQPDDSMIFNRI